MLVVLLRGLKGFPPAAHCKMLTGECGREDDFTCEGCADGDCGDASESEDESLEESSSPSMV